VGDPGIDGRTILRLMFRKWDVGGVDWIKLAQDRDMWHALVNSLIILHFPQNTRNFLTSSKLVSFSRKTLLHGVIR
jgi:hypothetical protein